MKFNIQTHKSLSVSAALIGCFPTQRCWRWVLYQMPVLLSPDCVHVPWALESVSICAPPITTVRVIRSAAVTDVGTPAGIPGQVGYAWDVQLTLFASVCSDAMFWHRKSTLYIHFIKCVFAHTYMYISPSYYKSIINLHNFVCKTKMNQMHPTFSVTKYWGYLRQTI